MKSLGGAAKSEQSITFLVDGVPVRRTLIALARRLDQICTAAASEAWATVGLTAMHGGVLAHLNKVDGGPDIDQKALAARMGVDHTSTSQRLYELEAMGLVERRINSTDRRERLLRLTTRGEKLREQVHGASSAAYTGLLTPLNPHERKLLLDLLVRVVESNSALARPGAGRRKHGYRVTAPPEKAKHSPAKKT